MPTAFPSDSDVASYLAVLGFDFTPRTGTAALAAARFMDATGRAPWFAALETRRFDPPQGRLLYLRGSCLAIEFVKVGDVEMDAAMYALRSPSELQFHRDVPPGMPGSVSVKGTWGYAPAGANAVPADAFEAVLRLAAAETIMERAIGPSGAGVTGPLSSARHGDVAYSYATPTLADRQSLVDPLLETYHDVVAKYTVLAGVA